MGTVSDSARARAIIADFEAKLAARRALNSGAPTSVASKGRAVLRGDDAIDADLRGRVSDDHCAAVMIAAALEYARRGWRVFPLKSDSKEPKIGQWPERASTDAETIKDWWRKWPHAGLGIATGHGLIVLDVDTKNDAGGAHSLKVLQVEHGELPVTLTVRTPGGGWHYYFRLPDGCTIRNSAG